MAGLTGLIFRLKLGGKARSKDRYFILSPSRILKCYKGFHEKPEFEWSLSGADINSDEKKSNTIVGKLLLTRSDPG